MSEDVHEIYAIRYGHHDRKASDNFIGGDPHDVQQPLDFYVWAIVGPRGPIVLDTGFDAAMGKKRQRETIKPVGDGLKACLLYTSPSPRDISGSRMPSSA